MRFLPLKIVLQLFGQRVYKRVVGYGVGSCRYHHKQVVGIDAGSQQRELVTARHIDVGGAQSVVPALHIFADAVECVGVGVELHPAAHIVGQAGRAFHPSVESRYILGFGGAATMMRRNVLIGWAHRIIIIWCSIWAGSVLSQFAQIFVGLAVGPMQSHNDFRKRRPP